MWGQTEIRCENGSYLKWERKVRGKWSCEELAILTCWLWCVCTVRCWQESYCSFLELSTSAAVTCLTTTPSFILYGAPGKPLVWQRGAQPSPEAVPKAGLWCIESPPPPHLFSVTQWFDIKTEFGALKPRWKYHFKNLEVTSVHNNSFRLQRKVNLPLPVTAKPFSLNTWFRLVRHSSANTSQMNPCESQLYFFNHVKA